MLDKLGKADIGESAKAMGVVFFVGLILTVLGGTLGAMIANDTTEYANIDTNGDGDERSAADANKIIGDFHNLGKGFVELIGFWLPVAGILMMAVGIGILSLRRAVMYTVLFSAMIVVPLVLLRDAIPAYVMVSLYVVALSLDVMSTVKSKRFPKYECNAMISVLYSRIGMKRTWIAYGVTYAGIMITGLVFLDGIHMILGILISVHIVAAIGNILSERTIAKKAQCIIPN